MIAVLTAEPSALPAFVPAVVHAVLIWAEVGELPPAITIKPLLLPNLVDCSSAWPVGTSIDPAPSGTKRAVITQSITIAMSNLSSAEGRAVCAGHLDARRELAVRDQRPIERLPAHNAQLVERVALVRVFQIGELDVIECHLRVGATADKPCRDR